jgi:hypothetical protein
MPEMKIWPLQTLQLDFTPGGGAITFGEWTVFILIGVSFSMPVAARDRMTGQSAREDRSGYRDMPNLTKPASGGQPPTV